MDGPYSKFVHSTANFGPNSFKEVLTDFDITTCGNFNTFFAKAMILI